MKIRTILVCIAFLIGCNIIAQKYCPKNLIKVSNDDVQIQYNETSAQVTIEQAPAFVLFYASDWMTCTQEGNVLNITTDKNTLFVPRKAIIILTAKKENLSRVITITQSPEPGHNNYFTAPKSSEYCLLTNLDLSKATHDGFIREVKKNESIDGHKVRIKNNTYETSVSTHAKSVFKFKLNGATQFVTDLGIDDDILSRDAETHGDVNYFVLVDGKEVVKGNIKITDKEAVKLEIDTKGANEMELIFDSNGSNWGDHVDLGNPYFKITGRSPEVIE